MCYKCCEWFVERDVIECQLWKWSMINHNINTVDDCHYAESIIKTNRFIMRTNIKTSLTLLWLLFTAFVSVCLRNATKISTIRSTSFLLFFYATTYLSTGLSLSKMLFSMGSDVLINFSTFFEHQTCFDAGIYVKFFSRISCYSQKKRWDFFEGCRITIEDNRWRKIQKHIESSSKNRWLTVEAFSDFGKKTS